ncbi:hypothetical protein ACOSQ4_025357 [Xanthoceras sorbifolium]
MLAEAHHIVSHTRKTICYLKIKQSVRSGSGKQGQKQGCGASETNQIAESERVRGGQDCTRAVGIGKELAQENRVI